MQAGKYWALVCVYIAFIFFLSSRPASAIPSFVFHIPYFDKFFHFFLYLGFSFLLVLALFKSIGNEERRKYIPLLVVIVGISLGALDELLQSYTTGRSATALDLGADALGVFAGQILFIILKLSVGSFEEEK